MKASTLAVKPDNEILDGQAIRGEFRGERLKRLVFQVDIKNRDQVDEAIEYLKNVRDCFSMGNLKTSIPNE